MYENSGEKNSESNHRDILIWQKKLLPWMITVPSVLILIFIFIATLQVSNFQANISHNDSLQIHKSLPKIESITVDTSIDKKLGYIQLHLLARMEEYSINRRYNQAGQILISGIYTKYFGFFTGMILAIVGAVFIISKLSEEASNFEGTIREQIRFKVISSSPGIIFGILGTILMVTTILKTVESKVTDMPLYLNHYNMQQQKANIQNALDDMEGTQHSYKKQQIDPGKADTTGP